MSQQTLSDGTNASFVSNRLIATAPYELPAESKWPRRWRYAFVLGSCLLFWIAVAIAIRWA